MVSGGRGLIPRVERLKKLGYEWRDDSSNWFRSYGNENWEFDKHGLKRWLRNFEQGAKWKLGLTAGMFCLRIRSEDEEASPPEPHTGLQGEGGPCWLKNDRTIAQLAEQFDVHPRHQLHPDGARLRLSHCRDGLVHTTHPGLATVEHDGGFVLYHAVEEALQNTAAPQIFNTDQGSQFTSTEFTSVLINNVISISMDGKGAWRDNVFVERFWRTIKYEEVYRRAL